MRAVDYVKGAYPAAQVDDLVSQGAGKVDLVFILESPHTDELIARHPVAGTTGRAALAILRGQARGPETLGGAVERNVKAGDARVAILNVSTVPLQEKAFRKRTNITAPLLTDWDVLDDMRDANKVARVMVDPAAQAITAALHTDLRRRMHDVPMSADCTVAVCGGFAHPFGRALSLARKQRLVEIRHPSNRWWEKSTDQWKVNLDLVCDVFRLSTQ